MNKDTADTIFFLIDRMIYARENFDRIKQDEQERKTSVLLGKRALLYDVILLIFIGGAAALTIWGITMDSGWKYVLYVVAALFAAAMIPFYMLAFNFSIKQLRLNKRAIGWISLMLPLLITAAAAICIVIFAL